VGLNSIEIKHFFPSGGSVIWLGAVALRQAVPRVRGAVPYVLHEETKK